MAASTTRASPPAASTTPARRCAPRLETLATAAVDAALSGETDVAAAAAVLAVRGGVEADRPAAERGRVHGEVAGEALVGRTAGARTAAAVLAGHSRWAGQTAVAAVQRIAREVGARL